jgi:nitrite reductase/ring-hydroxylating ferredoxin subunit
MSEPYVVANAADVPEGQHLIVRVRGREIGLFNVRGRFYALPNACFHQNGPLCRGAVGGTLIANADTGWKNAWAYEGEIIVCPWHALEYNVTTGQCLAYPDRRLPTWEVQVQDGQLVVFM